jgi:hypothetical protein
VAEIVLDEGSTPEMVEAFRREFPAHPHELWIYGDAAGQNRSNQTAQSDYQLILNALRTYPSPVRLKVPAANPLVRDRVNAANAALQDEHGASHVEIDPSCHELIADLEQVLSDGKGGIKKTQDRRDPYFRRTHTSDAWSYWLVYEAPVSQSPGRSALRLSGAGESWVWGATLMARARPAWELPEGVMGGLFDREVPEAIRTSEVIQAFERDLVSYCHTEAWRLLPYHYRYEVYSAFACGREPPALVVWWVSDGAMQDRPPETPPARQFDLKRRRIFLGRFAVEPPPAVDDADPATWGDDDGEEP